ncbi:stage IV sporulation protein FB [Paenisporosarcina quisquiliarum]|uniref:site-2 protease family protein n=1 Tax=Psychrobacillus TaxID=1221880 RepID=UPI0008D1BF5F|nr:stage IV sporulation protein FB [Paenisporosarcina quisquiliarum]
MNKQLFRVHPIMIPFFLFFYLSGEIAMYALVFSSLLVHELGHLFIAVCMGAKVQSCTILPYGGEIKMEQFSKLSKTMQVCVILGGPFFTLLLLLFGMLVDFPQANIFIMTQILILGLNLLPIFPLDGGRIIHSIFPDRYEGLIGFSGCICVVVFTISCFYFPEGLVFTLIFLFLAFQNLSYWRFRKYKLAFDWITKSA